MYNINNKCLTVWCYSLNMNIKFVAVLIFFLIFRQFGAREKREKVNAKLTVFAFALLDHGFVCNMIMTGFAIEPRTKNMKRTQKYQK